MRYKFTDKEIKEIEKNLVILIDTREQKNKHITDFFDKKKIHYKVQKLDYGDYSCMIPAGTIDKFTSDIYFDRELAIERKANIDEFVNNLKENASRLKKELAHLNMYQMRYLIFIEDANFEENLRQGNYISQYDPYTLLQRLYKGVEAEYNTAIIGLDKKVVASKIYNTLQARVYALLKHKGFIEGVEPYELTLEGEENV